jgi:hypothetical protein
MRLSRAAVTQYPVGMSKDHLKNVGDATPSTARDAPAARETTRPIHEAARRALAEAEERRRHAAAPAVPEVNGRGGLDPARYGDWEVKGIAADF